MPRGALVPDVVSEATASERPCCSLTMAHHRADGTPRARVRDRVFAEVCVCVQDVSAERVGARGWAGLNQWLGPWDSRCA